MKAFRLLGLLPALLALGGCNVVLLNPAGDVALQQRNLLLASTGLMLLIILPVLFLTLFFAWRYRESNKDAVYDPSFHHSTALEVVIWTAPLLIIIALGALTWMGTHLLDPYRPIGRVSAAKPLTQGGTSADSKPLTPLVVQVVALDWKWLFFYPEQGIATVNELAAPVDRPIEFKLTAATVMNSFFVPSLAGMVYAMPGMEMKLHAVMNKVGVYQGLASHYSGAGFSRMTFKFHGLSDADFDGWIAKAKSEGERLDGARYAELEKPSERDPVRYFGSTEPGLYEKILGLCTRPGKMCMSEMMQIDSRGGSGLHSHGNRERLNYDSERSHEGIEGGGATFPASGRPPRAGEEPQGMHSAPSEPTNQGTPPGGHGGHGDHTVPAPQSGPAPAQITR